MLVYSILEGKKKEAIFWLLELVDSDEQEKAWALLVRTWLMYYNFMYDFWILAAIRCAECGLRRPLLIDLCLALTGCKARDCSAVVAVLIQQNITDSDRWSLLRLRKLQRWAHIIGKDLALCGAVIWESGKEVDDSLKWKEWVSVNREEIKRWIGVLDGLVGRKGRRMFAVQTEILYGLGGRGILHREETTRWRLQGDPMAWREGGDGWWKKEMERYSMGYGDEDDRLDNWWKTHFIGGDDIPDEWGLDEIGKSHGDGILPRGALVSQSKIWRIWWDEMPARLGQLNLKKVCQDSRCNIGELWWGGG